MRPARSRTGGGRSAALALLAAVSAPGTVAAQPWNRPTPSPSPAVAGELDARTAARIDALFARWDGADRPGVALAILDEGRIVFSRGYGLADLEQATPIGPRTRFHVASVSKQFTAFAIVRLAARGALSLSDDVRRHLPELPWAGATITIENLLEHTSGMRDQWTLLTLAGWRMDDVITRHDVLGLLARQRELNFAPGTEHVYSNSGYTLAAEIVDRVTGRPFADWMREEVFEPLGLLETHVHADHQALVRGRARSYAAGPDGRYVARPLNYATVGATSVFTTAEDLLRWADRFMSPGPFEDGFARMVEPGRLVDGRALDYALGVVLGKSEGRRTVEHGGGDAGFRSHLLMFPDDGLAVAVLGNDASMRAGRLAHRVAGLVLADRPPPVATGTSWTPDRADRDGGSATPEPEVAIDRAVLARLVGPWWSPRLAAVRRLRLEKGGLALDRGDGEPRRLRHIGNLKFRVLDVDEPVHVTFGPERGPVTRMRVETPDSPAIELERLEPVPVTLPVEGYAGAYTSPELGITVRIAADRAGLVLRHPRHGTVALEPIARDHFQSDRWWLGAVRFERDPEGRITGFRCSSDRVRHLRFDRIGSGGAEGGEPARFSSPPGGDRGVPEKGGAGEPRSEAPPA